MQTLTGKSSRALRSVLLAALLMTSMSWSGCAQRRVTIIPSVDAEVVLRGGQMFEVPHDGVYLSNDRYRRYRRAIADQILKEQSK